MANHQEHNSNYNARAASTPIPHTRLTEPLPPLPSSELQLESQAIPQLTITTTHIPYHDDPAGDDINLATLQTHLRAQLSPPGYEPMYDYLRSQQRPQIYSQMSNQPPLYTSASISPDRRHTSSVAQEPYRDEPFVVTVRENGEGENAAPPPSYEELYRQHEIEMRRLVREFDTDGNPSEQTEELVKWVVAMLLVCLTIAGVGTALNWGRPM